jgi:hypothetical protein
MARQERSSNFGERSRTIRDVNIGAMGGQQQIYARQVRTGQPRGDKQERGLTEVVDGDGRVVMIFGFKPGAFA